MKMCLWYLIVIIVIILTACITDTSYERHSLLSDTHRVYLPLIYSPTVPMFCVENEDVDFDIDLAAKYRGECLAVSIHWGLVARDGWGYVDRKVGSFDGPLFLKIKGAPAWVTLAETCRPIPQNSWSAFSDFVRVALARYSGTIVAEFMNEPDVSSSWAEWWLGCWGDTYAEGQYYGEFVSAVYTDLKPDYPNISFIGGALMRPDNEFSAGALSVMQADAASFHYYPWCGGTSEYDYLYQTVQSKTDLPIWFSETGLLYHDDAPSSCADEQAEYIRELRDLRGIEGIIYYTLGCREYEWNNSSIYGEGCSIKPSVIAYEEIMR